MFAVRKTHLAVRTALRAIVERLQAEPGTDITFDQIPVIVGGTDYSGSPDECRTWALSAGPAVLIDLDAGTATDIP